ncbi:MAG: hypothetical protein VYA34_02925 [Myxococcota bacterium]|nr:hypothetical protein [Myxococcota bacterium]
MQLFTHKILSQGTLFLLTTLWSGCGVFSDAQYGSVTRTTYDQRLPNALEEVFEACTQPLVFNSNTTSVDLLANCPPGPIGAGPAVIMAGLNILGPLNLPQEAVEAFETGYSVHGTLPTLVPIPGPLPPLPAYCFITYQADASLNELSLENLRADWHNRGSIPSLRVQLDGSEDSALISFETQTGVMCPPISPAFPLLPWYNLALQGILPNGNHSIFVADLDIDLFVKLSHNQTDIIASLEVVIDTPSGITTSLPITNAAPILDFMQANTTNIGNSITDMLSENISDLELTQLEDALESNIPLGHIICDIEVQNSELVIITDHPKTPLPCREISFTKRSTRLKKKVRRKRR